MRHIVRYLVAASIAALVPMAASAVTTNPPDCVAAFSSLPSGDTPTNALILPVHPTAADTLTICTRDYVYSDAANITHSGAHISVVVIDNGWSWSPNPQIVLSNSLGRLAAGNYTLDAGIQDIFNPPPGPPRAIATGLEFSVAPAGGGGGAVVVATPTLSTATLAALALLLVGVAFMRRRAE